ncbi:MAG: hypothetical protein ACD_44C00296G0002 [uncultured bacterium]|nr:MAG: hypothetical protein ACD_44C00296G0002 [uncultured bacterium]OGT16217.1 MAG: magnesium/cobalt efflux protein [Gammaproteobacteria bacterium RIFCSPHIGHO2_02_FULL_38_33]OGT24183.1 MAG: magnesium/cobalt efflux protein [Gammaproteobacteria bacterium RIFCSPHIGHO2_12_38_15]OGT69633.1 MAG: magnesium/cobalt efflux protein [Gammaproteobacteria bacterium RIFCSPLOWO2_02_FULL_38_11]OGT75482.1 MAG: magnesium/cobalt efflux protein [Gammaproteobacteria bacterium RIFCSPLOWO2_12_FULL_38_14]
MTNHWLERLSHAFLKEPKNRDELFQLLQEAQLRDVLDLSSLKMIEGVLHISELHVRDIMVPRAAMVIIEHNQTLEEILPIVIESGHSRFPVMGIHRDEVKGILLAKDLLKFQLNKELKINSLLRPHFSVPESKRVDILLHEFRAKRSHMAIVLDEYASVSGLITIEDILEEIVGDIEDEYDVIEDENISRMGNNHFFIKGLTPIKDFNEYFKTQFDDNEFDTIGGLITRAFGHVPKKGEITSINNLKFKILQSDSRRIYSLRITPKKII